MLNFKCDSENDIKEFHRQWRPTRKVFCYMSTEFVKINVCDKEAKHKCQEKHNLPFSVLVQSETDDHIYSYQLAGTDPEKYFCMGYILKQIYRLGVLTKFVLSYLSKNKNECGASATSINHLRPPLSACDYILNGTETSRLKIYNQKF